MRSPFRIAAVAAVGVLSLAALAAPAAMAKPAGGQQTAVIYNSVVGSPLPGNLPSVGAEAYAFNELGNQVTFAGSNRQLTNVIVTMSSWGCVTGSWYAHDCATPAGATFSVPITLSLYDPSGDTAGVDDRIATVTQTFAIPYRPSASARCTGDNAGKWWDSSLKKCFNGTAVNVTFNLSGVTAPDTLVYGISYNTSHFGPAPITDSSACPLGGCGYDSLNIALSQDPTDVTVGSDNHPGTVWQNSSNPGAYCDGGTAGTFRLDSPDPAASCWGVDAPYTDAPFYVPAVQFKAGGGRG